MKKHGEVSTSRKQWHVVRDGWLWVVIASLVGAALGALVAVRASDSYVSTARLYVASAVESGDPEELYYRFQISGARVASYVELVASDAAAAAAADNLGDGTDPSDLADAVVATIVPGTVVIDLQVTADSPERSRDLAAAYAEAMPDVVLDAEGTTDSAAQIRITTIDEPTLGVSSTRGPVLNAAVGAALGAVAAVLLLLLVNAARRQRAIDRPT